MKFYGHLRSAGVELRSPFVRSSSHAMMVGCILLLVSLWPLLVIFEGWPFSYVLPVTISLPLAAGFVLGCIVELLRRGWNFRVFITMLLCCLAVAVWIFVLRSRIGACGVA
jgi:hypothetical protein